MVEPPAGPSRYLRQETFAPLGPDGQRKLAAASVLIVGVGGLGSHLAELLARGGVGRLRLVDDDRVDTTNLHRQAMYETAHVGRAKVDAATERLAAINPEVTIESRRRRLTPREAVELADGMDLIVDGTDNFATRYLLNDLAVRTALPWVSGGAIGAEGQVFRVQPRRTPCLRCLWPDPTEDSPALTCAVQGVIGPIVAAVAAVQAAEAIKLLTAPESLPPANLIRLDLWAGVARAIDLGQPDPSCPCCAHDQMSFLEP